LNERNSHVCMWCTAPIVTVTMAWSSIHYDHGTLQPPSLNRFTTNPSLKIGGNR
jgi:hypothetical protein